MALKHLFDGGDEIVNSRPFEHKSGDNRTSVGRGGEDEFPSWKTFFDCDIISLMQIRLVKEQDRRKLHSILTASGVFTSEEMGVAMELIDIVLRDSSQKDYTVHCLVDGEDQPLGYICYGRAPMTRGTYDLYWIAVDLRVQNQGIGSRLVDFLEETLKGIGGRMIVVETSSIPSYDMTQKFYLHKGFQEVGRVHDYYHPENDRVTYCKKLL